MIETEISPSEIYQRRDQLGLTTSLSMLEDFAYNSEKSLNRIQAIKYIGLLGAYNSLLKEKCYEILENFLISEENTAMKCESARSLATLGFNKGAKPLKWILKQKQIDQSLKLATLKALSKLHFEEEEIDLFIRELDCEDDSIHECVKNTLIDLSPAVLIQSLVRFLQKDDLSYSQKIEIIKLLSLELNTVNVSFDDTSYVRVKFPDVVASLKAHKTILVETIIQTLHEGDKDFFQNALDLLSFLGEEVHSDLIEALEREDFIIKTNAIKLIGQLQIGAAVQPLLRHLDDMYNEVNIASIEALGEIGDLSAVPELLKVFDIDEMEYEYLDIDLKWYILESIKNIYMRNKDATFETLLEYINTDNAFLKESIAFILGEIAHEEFTQPLLSLLEERNVDVKKNAVIALGKVGDQHALDALFEILDDPHTYWLIKKVVVDAIFNIFFKLHNNKKEHSLELKRAIHINRAKLMEYLNQHPDECFKVKLSIIKFLEAFGDKTSLDFLLKLLNDFHRLVRISAEKAIKTIEKRLEPDTSA